MPKTTVSLSKPITPSISGDVLSRVLNSMMISKNLLMKEKYKIPWAVFVPNSKQGMINIRLKNGESTLVETGEMVVSFFLQNRTYLVWK